MLKNLSNFTPKCHVLISRYFGTSFGKSPSPSYLFLLPSVLSRDRSRPTLARQRQADFHFGWTSLVQVLNIWLLELDFWMIVDNVLSSKSVVSRKMNTDLTASLSVGTSHLLSTPSPFLPKLALLPSWAPPPRPPPIVLSLRPSADGKIPTCGVPRFSIPVWFLTSLWLDNELASLTRPRKVSHSTEESLSSEQQSPTSELPDYFDVLLSPKHLRQIQQERMANKSSGGSLTSSAQVSKTVNNKKIADYQILMGMKKNLSSQSLSSYSCILDHSAHFADPDVLHGFCLQCAPQDTDSKPEKEAFGGFSPPLLFCVPIFWFGFRE